ncbi:MAG: Hint domain-containing protein [Pseudomonadota bacterium]
MRTNKAVQQQATTRRAARKIADWGICEGAPVLTDQGMRPVEAIGLNDYVLTSVGLQRLRKRQQLNRVTHGVYIVAGSLGHRCIRRDTLLPAGQPVMLRDWRAQAFRGIARALVPVGELIDGEYIRCLGQIPMTLYRLSFGTPGILHADGLELGCASSGISVGRVGSEEMNR